MEKNATLPKWQLREGDTWWDVRDELGENPVISCGMEGEVTIGIEDARFTVLSRNLCRAMIDRIRELEEEVKKTKKKYVIARTYSAGVFAGFLESKKGREVILSKARRLWYWKGAASLSQLAMEGVKDPHECKFPCEVDRVELLETIEILDCTEAARKNIAKVPVWKE